MALAGFAVAVALVATVGALSNAPHIDGWYADADKVAWSPPGWLFAPAWTVLYVLMVISGFILWKRGFSGSGRESATKPQLTLFVVQLILNGLWSPAFFAWYPQVGAAAWWTAMAIMIALIVAVVFFAVKSKPVSSAVAWMQVPYVAWLLFASTLNAGIIALNS